MVGVLWISHFLMQCWRNNMSEQKHSLDITMNTYQAHALETAIYPESLGLFYTTLGLAGEAGELCNKVKKVLRDSGGELTQERRVALRDELGDVMWYAATLAYELNTDLGTICTDNINKLASRKERGTLKGDGDNR